ncbi:hypothetical protein GGR56DRAFT_386437 [Xylariaceae sp. FL0804]|nr:hypothetical protein GGR56DRAFT_386437 [Xylariaceae sp. FL0804]
MTAVEREPWVLMAIGLSFITLRIYARWDQFGLRNLQLDDYLMVAAGLFFTADVVLAYLVGALYNGLTNSYMTPEERAALSPDSDEYQWRQSGSKVQVAGWSFYVLVLWLIKTCFAILFSRLSQGLNRRIKLHVRGAFFLIGVTYLVVALGIVLSCQPMHRFWQINPDPGDLCRPANSMFYVVSVLVTDLMTDIYLLTIPINLLWGTTIPTRKKVALIALFSGSFFVIIAGLIRAISILVAGAEGALTGSRWADRETFVAIIVANLPASQPLFRKWASKAGLSGLFSRSSPTSRGRSYPLRSGTEHVELSRRRTGVGAGGRAAGLVSDHKGTAWASEEHILGPVDKPRSSDSDKQPERGQGRDIMVTHEIRLQSDPV